MNTNPIIPSWRMATAIALGWILSTLAAFAQQATGTIQGRVYNPATQEYVRNAEVRLDGTNQVTYTEGDGTFSFAGVAAGQASVTINYSGYNVVKDTFTVTAGQTASREFNLTSTAAAPPRGRQGWRRATLRLHGLHRARGQCQGDHVSAPLDEYHDLGRLRYFR